MDFFEEDRHKAPYHVGQEARYKIFLGSVQWLLYWLMLILIKTMKHEKSL